MANNTARSRKQPTPVVGELLTPRQAAERLNVTLGCLVDWRYRKVGPPVIKLGKLCRYPSALLEEFIASRLQGAA
jgi:hypothetical protein